MTNIPEVKLSSSSGHRNMPVIALGLGAMGTDDSFKTAVLEAIKLGYRHFDSALLYPAEKALGEAIAEAIKLGLISSREELFITSKLWVSEAHRDLVLPSLQKSLRNLQTTYLDLYLIHWPLSSKPTGSIVFPIPEDHLQPMDYKGVWEAMEECQRLGFTKSIGVSNFSCKKLETILSLATIPPSVNQVELNPVWQQRKLIEFCKAHRIIVSAYFPLGSKGIWGNDLVLGNEALKQIAKAHGKSVAQVSLRWIFEQGATFAVKSFNKGRMKENMEIFDWALTDEDYEKINKIEQHRMMPMEGFVTPNGPFKTLGELWDE